MAATSPEPIERMGRDLRLSSRTLGEREARYLTDLYYQVQDYRKRGANQALAQGKDGEPLALADWVHGSFERVEAGIKGALHEYAKSKPLGLWALSIHGIGPVIAAGLLAHISVYPWKCIVEDPKKRCKEAEPCTDECRRIPVATAGGIWRFAGLDPTQKWGKGKVRPWNARLKVLCWKTGESFVRLRASENDIYGKVYEARKQLEVARNERGEFAATAARTLKEKKFTDKETIAIYEAGKLPAGRLDLRAKRYAVKLFLSHYHHVAYELQFGEPPPKPYVLTEQGGHAHFIAPPNWRGEPTGQ